MLRRIHSNADNLVHARLPCLRFATTSFWHTRCRRGPSTPSRRNGPRLSSAPLTRSTASGARFAIFSSIKPEMHNVAIGDDVLLAFQPQLAGIAGAGLAAERDVIGVGDGFGADKSLFEIGMDHAGRGGRLGAAVDGPGPRLLRPDREIGDEVQ